MSEAGNHGAAIRQIVQAAAQARRQDLLAALVQEVGWIVQAGPFAGMALQDRISRANGDLLPKLLGCYEAELHSIIEEIVAAEPDLVVNVGAAEGYYAVGLARLLPNAFIHVFDTDAGAQEACRLAAASNDVKARVSVAGQCSPDLLQAILPRGRTPVVICDCEGYERTLIDLQRVPALRAAMLLIECHDFIDASVTQTLADRLNATHTLIGIREGARDPNSSPLLQRLESLDRWLAVCENRPTMMHWLVARPK